MEGKKLRTTQAAVAVEAANGFEVKIKDMGRGVQRVDSYIRRSEREVEDMEVG